MRRRKHKHRSKEEIDRKAVEAYNEGWSYGWDCVRSPRDDRPVVYPYEKDHPQIDASWTQGFISGYDLATQTNYAARASDKSICWSKEGF
jgi:hypothetical protein